MFKKVLYISLATFTYLSTPFLSAMQTSPDYVLLGTKLPIADEKNARYVIASSKLKLTEISKAINGEGKLTWQFLLLMQDSSNVDISSEKNVLSEIVNKKESELKKSLKEEYKLNQEDLCEIIADEEIKWALTSEGLKKKFDKSKLSPYVISYHEEKKTSKRDKLQPLNEFYVLVKLLSGSIILIKGQGVESDEATIESIKEKIEAIIKMPVAEQNLYYNNTSLEDQEKAKKYGISQGVQIKLIQTSQSSQNPNNNPIPTPLNNTNADNGLNDGTGKLSFGKGTILVICVVAGLTAIAVISQKQSNKEKEFHSNKKQRA